MKTCRQFMPGLAMFGLAASQTMALSQPVYALAGQPEPEAPQIAVVEATPAESASQYVEAQNLFDKKVADFNFFTGDPVAGSRRPLVIPKDATGVQALEGVDEDLNVMGRILEKAATAGSEKGRKAMGILIRSGAGGGTPRDLYLEGYGALFFLNVNYPLVAPAKAAEPETKANTSSEWEEARRELYEPQTPKMNWQYLAVDGDREEYDAERVEGLKRELISSLKNAAHIKKLKDDESVTIIVTGRGARTAGHATTAKNRTGSATAQTSRTSGVTHTAPIKVWAVGGAPAESGSKLIFRIRKSDAEAFQKEQITPEEFRKRVVELVY